MEKKEPSLVQRLADAKYSQLKGRRDKLKKEPEDLFKKEEPNEKTS